MSAVGGEVERVDLLDVALEQVADPALGDVPDLREVETRSVTRSKDVNKRAES